MVLYLMIVVAATVTTAVLAAYGTYTETPRPLGETDVRLPCAPMSPAGMPRACAPAVPRATCRPEAAGAIRW
ncbi:hypothetical protein [Nocardia africana]|uniref:Uncharacterized protein n=1 Tax=Nocardia africana TaxID=134964 RepID=A0ABW6NMU0_9NOCA